MDNNIYPEKNKLKLTERMKKNSFGFWLFGLGALVMLDQLLKYSAFHSGSVPNFLNRLNPVFQKVNFKNYNFAFSIVVPPFVMYAAYGLVLFFLLRYLIANFKALGFGARLAWLFIFAGAFSNICERIILGYVRDFIYFYSGIFNLADIYIFLGILLLMVYTQKEKKHDI
jgi:signal peptidase II